MADSAAIKAGRAFVEIFTDDLNFQKSLDKTAKQFKKWGASLSAMGRKIFTAGAGLATPLLAATKVFADMGSELARASQKTGIGVEALSQLKYAAQQSGVSLEGLEVGLKKMSKAIFDAAQGSPQATQSLADLGLTVDQLKNLSPDQQFKKIAGALANVQSPTEKAALAMRLFGKSGVDLIPLLDEGAGGIDALMKRADELGLTMTGKDAEAALEFGQRMSDLWDVVKMGVFTIGGALAPVVRSLAIALMAGVKTVREFITAHKGIVTLAAGIAVGLMAAGIALVALGTAFSLAGTAIGLVLSGFTVLATVVGAVLSPIGMMVAGIAAGTYALFKFTDVGSSIGGYLSGVFETLKTDAVGAFRGIKNALVAGDWSLAARILWTFLKLEFARGSAVVLANWAIFKSALASTWANVSAGIATAWSYVVEYLSNWDGVKAAGQKFLTWLSGSFQNTINHVADLLQDLFFSTGKKQLKIDLQHIDELESSGKISHETADSQRAAAHKTYDSYDDQSRSQRDAQLNADQAGKQKSIDDAYAAKQPGAVAGAQAARDRIEAERQKQLAESEAALARQIAAASDPKGVNELKAQLLEMRKQAAREAVSADVQSKLPKKFDPKKASAGLDDLDKTSVAGTFNADQAFGLAGSGPLDAIAENTAKAAELLAGIATSNLNMARTGLAML